MFPLEQGAFEMLLIGAIALIVVGPKDLPVVMRKVGQFTAKLRGMAAEFRASFDEMARQSELEDLRREVEALRSGSYLTPGVAETPPALPGPALPDSSPAPSELAGSPAAPEVLPQGLDLTAPSMPVAAAGDPQIPGPAPVMAGPRPSSASLAGRPSPPVDPAPIPASAAAAPAPRKSRAKPSGAPAPTPSPRPRPRRARPAADGPGSPAGGDDL